MHPYLPHLFSDISNAYRAEIPEEAPQPAMTFEEEMEEIENWVEGEEAEHSFGYYCGLDTINFPPPDQLTGDELKTIIEAFGHMMFSWNLEISLPEKLPLPIAYAITVDTLNSKTSIPKCGFLGFDFCTGYAPDYIFKEYCPCLEIWNAEDDTDLNMDSPSPSTDELPF